MQFGNISPSLCHSLSLTANIYFTLSLVPTLSLSRSLSLSFLHSAENPHKTGSAWKFFRSTLRSFSVWVFGPRLFSPVKPHTNYTCAFYKSTHTHTHTHTRTANIFLSLGKKRATELESEQITTRTYFHFHGQKCQFGFGLQGKRGGGERVGCWFFGVRRRGDKYANSSTPISLPLSCFRFHFRFLSRSMLEARKSWFNFRLLSLQIFSAAFCGNVDEKRDLYVKIL